ncbi:MAG TPA: hypothetical protein VJ625_17175 [Propionibacteriaceae bacterium]|nr:hypothetical protein [Propionibacteriaceae bacterium]
MEPESLEFQRGKIAYEAYYRDVGGVSAVTGLPLRAFKDTNDTVQSGWIAAAAALFAAADSLPTPEEGSHDV